MMKAQSEGYVRVFPIGAITKGQEGVELTEIGAMVRGRLCGYFGRWEAGR
jgi:hypothetical protein